MPLEHSENKLDGSKVVDIYENEVKELQAKLKEIQDIYLFYAKEHLKVIEKFGHYPKRNEALGRTST